MLVKLKEKILVKIIVKITVNQKKEKINVARLTKVLPYRDSKTTKDILKKSSQILGLHSVWELLIYKDLGKG